MIDFYNKVMSFLGSSFFSIFIISVLLLVFALIIAILVYRMLKVNKIKNNIPKQKFEYLDAFIYITLVKRNEGGDLGITTSHEPTLLFVIRDITTSKVYAIFENPVYVNAGITLFGAGKNIKIQKIGKEHYELKFYDKGNFWIEKELHDCYYREENYIKFWKQKSKRKLQYIGNIQNIESITTEDTLYNLNPEFDISILDKATFINGIVEFETK